MRSQNETAVKHIVYNYTHKKNDVKRTRSLLTQALMSKEMLEFKLSVHVNSVASRSSVMICGVVKSSILGC